MLIERQVSKENSKRKYLFQLKNPSSGIDTKEGSDIWEKGLEESSLIERVLRPSVVF